MAIPRDAMIPKADLDIARKSVEVVFETPFNEQYVQAMNNLAGFVKNYLFAIETLEDNDAKQ